MIIFIFVTILFDFISHFFKKDRLELQQHYWQVHENTLVGWRGQVYRGGYHGIPGKQGDQVRGHHTQHPTA